MVGESRLPAGLREARLRRTGLSVRTVRDLEQGWVPLPRPATLRRLTNRTQVNLGVAWREPRDYDRARACFTEALDRVVGACFGWRGLNGRCIVSRAWFDFSSPEPSGPGPYFLPTAAHQEASGQRP